MHSRTPAVVGAGPASHIDQQRGFARSVNARTKPEGRDPGAPTRCARTGSWSIPHVAAPHPRPPPPQPRQGDAEDQREPQPVRQPLPRTMPDTVPPGEASQQAADDVTGKSADAHLQHPRRRRQPSAPEFAARPRPGPGADGASGPSRPPAPGLGHALALEEMHARSSTPADRSHPVGGMLELESDPRCAGQSCRASPRMPAQSRTACSAAADPRGHRRQWPSGCAPRPSSRAGGEVGAGLLGPAQGGARGEGQAGAGQIRATVMASPSRRLRRGGGGCGEPAAAARCTSRPSVPVAVGAVLCVLPRWAPAALPMSSSCSALCSSSPVIPARVWAVAGLLRRARRAE